VIRCKCNRFVNSPPLKESNNQICDEFDFVLCIALYLSTLLEYLHSMEGLKPLYNTV